jgi:hypothetical protein
MNILASPTLFGGKKGKGREGGIFIQPSTHSCKRAPEWNSLCGLVDSERKKKGGKLPFWKDKNENIQDAQSIFPKP